MTTEYPKINTVFKRDPETNNKKLIEGNFSLPEFEYLQNNIWEWSEKLDGTNLRTIFNKNETNKIVFWGKTNQSQTPSTLVNYLNNKFLPLKEKFEEVFDTTSVCLYGEGVGKDIQKGGGNYGDPHFVLIDVVCNGWWLQREDVVDIAYKFNINVAPIIGKGNLFEMVEKTRHGFKSAWGNFFAEGIVARPMIELKNRRGDRIITKIKYKDFN